MGIMRLSSKRSMIYLSAFMCCLFIGLSTRANDFRQNKALEEWSQEELLKLLNDSPWTRKVNLWQLTGRRLAVFRNGKKAVYQTSPSSTHIHYSPEP